MGFFNRKKSEHIEIPTLKHEHTWKDMPWYMETWYSGREHTASYYIKEPYVCIVCGERKDITLEKEEWNNISVEGREERYKEVREKYAQYLKPRAIVEDMINDIQYVKDTEHLEMVELLLNSLHKGVGSSSKNKPTTKEHKGPVIEVKK